MSIPMVKDILAESNDIYPLKLAMLFVRVSAVLVGRFQPLDAWRGSTSRKRGNLYRCLNRTSLIVLKVSPQSCMHMLLQSLFKNTRCSLFSYFIKRLINNCVLRDT